LARHVPATYFMTYHTPMRVSGDYITGLREARDIAKNISAAMNLHGDQEVFPYRYEPTLLHHFIIFEKKKHLKFFFNKTKAFS